ncbi:MAG TPA: 3-hydroxyacyl-CoA dehydrogenase NAD-binding domain-containing protein, partial [Candidatus Binatia bacterium]
MIDTSKTVGVVGLGVMGFDIAFLYAQKGYRTLVYDASEAAMQNLVSRRDQTMERLTRRNRISEIEIEKVKKHLVPAARLSDMTNASLVTEAISESGNIKRSVYRTLREIGFSGVLTTNTSSLTRKSLIESGDY